MFEFSSEQELFRETVRQLALKEIAPHAKEIDETGTYPQGLRELLHSTGLFSLMLPAEYGGADGSNVTFCIAVEELARVCGSSALVVLAHAVGLYPLVIGGSDSLKQEYYSAIAQDGVIAAFCLTEPEVGSDAASITTEAKLDGDHYILKDINQSNNLLTYYEQYRII